MNIVKCSCKGSCVESLVPIVEIGVEGISEVGPSGRFSGQVLKGRDYLRLACRGGSPQSHPDWLPAWHFSHWFPQMPQLLPSAGMDPHRLLTPEPQDADLSKPLPKQPASGTVLQ